MKMERLPLTSATKMIDYWLILCQLVPFAQVVLLTAMEYLREEEKEEEKQVKDLHLAHGIEKGLDQGGVVVKADDELKHQEAWIPVTAYMTQKLLTIGKGLEYLLYFHNLNVYFQKIS